jgi:hypothetical protein
MSITSTTILSSTGMSRGWRTGNFHHFIASCSWAFIQVIGPVKGYKTWIRWGWSDGFRYALPILRAIATLFLHRHFLVSASSLLSGSTSGGRSCWTVLHTMAASTLS